MVFQNRQVRPGKGFDEAVESEVRSGAGRAFRTRENLGQDRLAFPVWGGGERFRMEGQSPLEGFQSGLESVRRSLDLDIEGTLGHLVDRLPDQVDEIGRAHV